MANTQVIQSPFLYAVNGQVAYASATTFTVAAGQFRDSGNVADIVIPASVTVNCAVNGAAGLDTGDLANSTWYYVWAIGDSTLQNNGSALLSASASTPTLPAGYDVYRLIGALRTNGSAQLLNFKYCGKGVERTLYWDSVISVLSGGSSTTLALVDCDGAVPPVAGNEMLLNLSFAPATANDTVGITPADSTATTIATLAGSVATKVNSMEARLPVALSSSKAQFKYINSAASGAASASVIGFVYYI